MALTYTALVLYLYPEVFHLQIPLPQLPLLFTSRNTQYSRCLCHRIPFFALVLFHRPEWRSCLYFFYFGMGLMASTIISRRLLIVSARQPWSTYMRLITAPDIQYPKTMDVQAWCYLHVTVLSTLRSNTFLTSILTAFTIIAVICCQPLLCVQYPQDCPKVCLSCVPLNSCLRESSDVLYVSLERRETASNHVGKIAKALLANATQQIHIIDVIITLWSGVQVTVNGRGLPDGESHAAGLGYKPVNGQASIQLL